MAKKKKGKFGKLLKKIAKGIAKGALNATTFLPLLPYRVAMVAILKKKGIKPKASIDDLAQQFYNVVIKKKESYEVVAVENLAGDVIASIVKAVISYFKDLKKKKDSGVKLPPVEDKALDAAERTIGKVMEEGKEEAKSEIAKKSFTPLLIIGVVAIILLFFALTGKKK